MEWREKNRIKNNVKLWSWRREKKILEADEMRDGLVTAAMGWSAGVSLVWVADGGGGDVVDGVTLFSSLLVSLSLSLSLDFLYILF